MILLIGVLASLCFSVGEGLRLLPLPHLPLRADECVDTRPRMESPSFSTLNPFQAGSISQPPQAQKNFKRNQVEWVATSHYNLPFPCSLRFLSGAEWRTGVYLSESASSRTGRAPPLTA